MAIAFAIIPHQVPPTSRPLPLQHKLGSRCVGEPWRPHCSASLAAVAFSFTWARRKSRCLARPAVKIDFPVEVAGYQCRTVVAYVPSLGEVSTLVVDETADIEIEGEQDDIPDWVPSSWMSPVHGDEGISDVYGAIGVWPAAFVASSELVEKMKLMPSPQPLRVVEIGCGAGFPSLVATKLGASVLAVDTESLPLALLRAAFEAQQPRGSLETFCGDAAEAPLIDADIVVVSDLLYSVDIGRSVGCLLGRAVAAGKHVILTDGRRTGTAAFLEEFQNALGRPGHFEEVPVPSWAPQRMDLFDGRESSTIGVLRY